MRRRVSPLFTASIYLSSDNRWARVAFILVKLVPLALYMALIFRSFWNWFITPLWPRPLIYGESVGIVLTIFLVRGIRTSAPAGERRDLWYEVVEGAAQVLGLTAFWGIAAGFHFIFN